MSAQPLPETRRKLDEARFFWARLDAEAKKAIRPEPEAFGYFLSAFLSAARSVSFVAQKEDAARYARVGRPWWDNLAEAERRLCDFMNDHRVAEVHRLGAPVSVTLRGVPAESVPGVQTFGTFLSREPALIIVTESYFEHGTERIPVVEAGKRYLDVLSAFVGHMEEAHP